MKTGGIGSTGRKRKVVKRFDLRSLPVGYRVSLMFADGPHWMWLFVADVRNDGSCPPHNPNRNIRDVAGLLRGHGQAGGRQERGGDLDGRVR